MGRGRRPNLALEPTRALQTQRAFRQRKAEHLAGLEATVKQLTDENARLRQLLQRDAASPGHSRSPHLTAHPPPAHVAASGSRSSASSTSASTPTSLPTATCESCAPILHANRQLAVAATHVDAHMAQLQHAVKSLRSVLVHHNIPVPAYLLEPPNDEAYRHSKRMRYEPGAHGDHASPAASGVHMTASYFAPGESWHDPAQRRSVPASQASQAWHTPSPGSILAAPTPPSAGYSPRHAGAFSPPATEARRRAPSRQSSTARLPPASPRYTQLPPLAPFVEREERARTEALHAGARSHSSGSSPAYVNSPFRGAAPLHSPRVRSVPSPRPSEPHLSEPPKPASTSEPNPCGSAGKPGCCSKLDAPPARPEPKDWVPAPLGISFDMRTSPTNDAKPSNDQECCFGLVNCDDQGRIII